MVAPFTSAASRPRSASPTSGHPSGPQQPIELADEQQVNPDDNEKPARVLAQSDDVGQGNSAGEDGVRRKAHRSVRAHLRDITEPLPSSAELRNC